VSEVKTGDAVPALQVDGLVKNFPGVLALDQASLTVLPGEFHGLIGENGAGKSTLIKILAGVYTPDAGSVQVAGRRLDTLTPAAVAEAGIRFVHQEVDLDLTQTVGEAVFLGQEVTEHGWLRTRQMRRRASAFITEYLGVDLDGGALLGDLGPGERKLVQIARALIDGQATLVVMDEPTAPLSAAEAERVFAAIATLRERQVACLYVSHYLAEVQQLTDRITVMRSGKVISTFEQPKAQPVEQLVSQMAGRQIAELFPAVSAPSSDAPVALRVEGLTLPGSFKEVSFELRSGEILGLAGLPGSGRNRLIDALAGLRKPTAGTISVGPDSKPVRLGSVPATAAAGIALVPRDRRLSGLVLDLPVAENLALGIWGKLARIGVVLRRPILDNARKVISALGIRPDDPDRVGRLLSGGNQQKTVLGRWIAADRPILVLEEPTVGVDAAAKAELYALIADLAAKGTSILLSCNDNAELAGLAHRVLVLRRGRVVAEVTDADQAQLLALASGEGEAGSPALATETAAAPSAPAAKSPVLRLRQPLIRLIPLAAAVLLLVVLAIRTPVILGLANLQSALTQAAPIAIVAMGLALVIVVGGDDLIAGGIDLSLPAIATLATAILAKTMAEQQWPLPLALLIAVLVATAFGALNALLVVGVGLTPILATLATSVLVAGVTRVYTTNRRSDITDSFIVSVRDDALALVPASFWLAAVVLAVLWIGVHRTRPGAHLRTIGGNRQAAVISGLRPQPYVVAGFTIAGAVAGVACITLGARGSGFSPGIEDNLLVDMLLAAYLSPVFSARGLVNVGGALGGAVLVALLSNALVLSSVDNSWVYGVKGALILAVVAVSALTRRKGVAA
jgi:ribose transport system ATP-binding protein